MRTTHYIQNSFDSHKSVIANRLWSLTSQITFCLIMVVVVLLIFQKFKVDIRLTKNKLFFTVVLAC